MKAIGRNLIIRKIKEGTTKTKGGLLLAESHRSDIRYIEANIISIGNDVVGVKEDDTIFFDKHAGHKIEVNGESYHVIKLEDIVVVL